MDDLPHEAHVEGVAEILYNESRNIVAGIRMTGPGFRMNQMKGGDFWQTTG